MNNNNELGTPNKQEINALNKFIKSIFKIKTADELIGNAEKSNLNKTLNAFDLITLGVGAIIGSGIFTVVGIAIVGGPESVGAGPALVVSMVLFRGEPNSYFYSCIFLYFPLYKI